MLTLSEIARATGGNISAGGQVLAPGPGHRPHDRSLSIKLSTSAPDGFVVFSHAGDDINTCRDHVRDKLGLPPWQPNGKGNGHASPEKEVAEAVAGLRKAKRSAPEPDPPDPGNPPRVVATYSYVSADGEVLYEVVRMEPKAFRQRRPVAGGGYSYKLGDVKPVLYRLPDLLKYPDATVFLTEGEKDAERLASLDLTATTISGSTTWTPELAEPLRGRDVIVLIDNDTAGATKAEKAAHALHGVAASVRLVLLPELPPGGDVSDYLDTGHSKEQLEQVCLGAPIWQPPDDKAPPPLPLTYYDDFGATAQKNWLLKGIMARGETSAWVGPPGSGKSALLTEITIHCSAQIDWRGHPAKARCGVVIFALERADLYRRRLWAYKQPGSPIAVAGTVIDLLNPDCAAIIASTVREAERHLGLGVGLIVIDTYSKGIAAGGGDEDKARDQNRAAANIGRIKEHLDVHVALVGHTGKDETRGARGSNAHLGDVDVMVQISGDTIAKLAQIVKANDQAARAIAEFRMEPIDLGFDEDGDAKTVWIVSAEHGEISAASVIKAKKKRGLPAVPKAALGELYELIADGETVRRPDDMHVPVGVTCVTLAKWKERLAKRGLINMDGSHRTQVARIHVTLTEAGIIGIWDGFAWPVT
jgi:AAA domain/Toprim-like